VRKPSATKLKGIGGGWIVPFYAKNLADTNPPPCKTPIFDIFSLVAPQP